MKAGKLEIGLFVLRLGLGSFLLLWSVDKLVEPETTTKIFGHFYHLTIPANVAVVVGVLECLLSLAIMAGLWKTWTYGLGLALHAVSTISTYEQLLSPFGKNHLFIAALPVLAAFVTLFILRESDTFCSKSDAGGVVQKEKGSFR
ncbi:DoxX family membrane protein [bacterium]|nr:DoxX family membrane protein [bacterium]